MKQPVDNTISAKCKAVISSYLISYASCIIREKQVSISFLYILHQQTWSFSKSCNGTNELICENCIHHERIKEISFIVQIAVFSSFWRDFCGGYYEIVPYLAFLIFGIITPYNQTLKYHMYFWKLFQIFSILIISGKYYFTLRSIHFDIIIVRMKGHSFRLVFD